MALLDDSSNGTEPTLQFITLVLPTLTLSPFISSSSFHFPSFSIKLSSDSAIITKSSAYSSSHGNPHPKCCISASSTITIQKNQAEFSKLCNLFQHEKGTLDW